jgi:hypothetical protein
VKTQVNEDIHMARLAKQAGLSLRVVENVDLYSTRMYDSPAAAFRGWSRIFFGSLPGVFRLLGIAFLLLVLSVGPWASLALAVVGRIRAAPPQTELWTWAVLAWVTVVILEQFVIARGYTMMRMPKRWSLAYPLSCLFTVGMLINAALKAAGASRTVWRGTAYRLHQREDDAPLANTHAGSPDKMAAPLGRGMD